MRGYADEHCARLNNGSATQGAGDGSPSRADSMTARFCRHADLPGHPYSSFHKVRHNTRKSYSDSSKIIEATVGKRLIRNFTVLDVQHWYDEWRKPAVKNGPERIDRAHDAVSMFKTVLRFNAALRRPECTQLVGRTPDW